jgi:hypothetical protein
MPALKCQTTPQEYKKPSKETVKNCTEFISLLREESGKQKNMSEQEKKDNAIKMGDIYY